MNVAIVETDLKGHRITFIQKYAKAFLANHHNVSVHCPKSKELLEILPLECDFYSYNAPRIKKYINNRFDWPLNSLNKWLDLNKHFKINNLSVEFVFFMSLDVYRFTLKPLIHGRLKPLRNLLDLITPTVLDKIFPYKWAGLSIQPQFDTDKILFAKYCKKIAVLNEEFDFKNTILNKKIVAFPDIANVEFAGTYTDFVIPIIKKAKGRKIVTVLGAMGKRKSILTLLDTAQILSEEPFFFIFAGEKHFQDLNVQEKDRVKTIEESTPDNCFFYFKRVEDGQRFNELIQISNIIFASYLNFMDSSNILTKTAFFKKPVIVSNNGIIAKRVKKYQMGVCIREGMASDVKKAIYILVDYYKLDDTKLNEYYTLHNEEQLMHKMETVLKS